MVTRFQPFLFPLLWIVFNLQVAARIASAFVTFPSYSSACVFVGQGKLQPPPQFSFSTNLFQTSPETSAEFGTTYKTKSELNFIREILTKNALFTNLPEDSLTTLINSFEKINTTRYEVIVTQGESCEGDYVYMIYKGQCKVRVNGKTVPPPYGTIQEQAMFGELGVLYDEPRGATITVRTPSATLFRVKGEIFKNILNKPNDDLACMQEIDEVINQVSGTKAFYGGDIIPQYKPQRIWLWSQLSGTVVKISLESTLWNMAFCVAIIFFAQQMTGVTNYLEHPTQFFWTADGIVMPDKDLPLVQNISLVKKIWEFQRSLTTFVLTFFINQAYGFWKDVYTICRDIQKHLDGFFLLLSTNVKRNQDGTLTPESIQLLEDVGQYSRLFHVLFWASAAQRFQVLETPQGLERMESRGMMTNSQLKILQNLDVPRNQLHLAPLEWILIRCIKGMDEGIVASDTATKGQLLKKIGDLRDSFMAIGGKMAGRMPLAYVHFVQILVDTFVLIAPIALYAELGSYSVVAVGVLTMFYTGLLNLAKIFLDPLNNEGFCKEDANFMDLGVLIRESNNGSTRWRRVGERLPFDYNA